MPGALRRLTIVLAAFIVATVGVIAQPPPPAAAEDHPYTTPGTRTYGGRLWRTTCDAYSTNVRRCRAEIFASQIRLVNGTYQQVNEFLFNNLTYLPSDRQSWVGNPLATPGTHLINGRWWQTRCFDEWTGPNGCRAFILATVIEAVPTSTGGQTYRTVEKWLFNNLVQFTPVVTPPTTPPPPTYDNPCNAPAPAGYAFTKEGRPHVIKTPYSPNTHYNPTSLSNFIRVALRSGNLTDEQRTCFAILGAEHLIAGSTTRTYDDVLSRWFPYAFEFSANPGIAPLQPGWISGLGQVGAMSALLEVYRLTGNQQWRTYAAQAFESHFVPLSAGGFTNRDNGFLWFEEYPTDPPTVVNNGHFENVIGLHDWAAFSKDPRAWALFDEAVADLKGQLPKAEVPAPGGIITSYDLVRGFPAAPLRAVATSPDTVITGTLHNGAPLKVRQDGSTVEAQLPLTDATTPSPSLIVNPRMDNVVNGVPSGWSAINGYRAGVVTAGGMVGARPSGTAWAGVEQIIPAGRFPAGARLSLSFDARLDIPSGQAGAGGKISAYSMCPTTGGTVTTLIHENGTIRGAGIGNYTSDFVAPASSCAIRLQLTTVRYTVSNTTAWYDNVMLRVADPVGTSVVPDYDLLVHRTWTNDLTVQGTGSVSLQAWHGGRWQEFGAGALSDEGLSVTIPERFTGRSLHYGYHDAHVVELMRIACQSADPFFNEVAGRWSAMATVAYQPSNCTAVPRVVESQGLPVLVRAEPLPMREHPSTFPTSMSLPEETS